MRRGLMYVNHNHRCSKPFYPSQQPHTVYMPQDEDDTLPTAPPDTPPTAPADTQPADLPAPDEPPAAAQPEPPAAPPKPRSTGALSAMLRQHDRMVANARKRADNQP